jgi:hypothetical protein
MGRPLRLPTHSFLQHHCFRQWLCVTMVIYFFQNFFHHHTKNKNTKNTTFRNKLLPKRRVFSVFWCDDVKRPGRSIWRWWRSFFDSKIIPLRVETELKFAIYLQPIYPVQCKGTQHMIVLIGWNTKRCFVQLFLTILQDSRLYKPKMPW